MANQTLNILLCCLVITAASISIAKAMEPNWSVCSDYYVAGCRNGMASDESFPDGLKVTGVSVRGLFVFFVKGLLYEPEGLGEFVFQSRFGDYHHLAEETAGKVIALKRMGETDFRIPALTMVNDLSLLSGGATRYSESSGTCGDNNSLTQNYSFKSLALNGWEPWEIFGRNGTSVCIQLEDIHNVFPGIVRDIRTLGLDLEVGNICRVVRGSCSKTPGEIIKIPNKETSGVLRR